MLSIRGEGNNISSYQLVFDIFALFLDFAKSLYIFQTFLFSIFFQVLSHYSKQLVTPTSAPASEQEHLECTVPVVARDLTDWKESRCETPLVTDTSDATRGGCPDNECDGDMLACSTITMHTDPSDCNSFKQQTTKFTPQCKKVMRSSSFHESP